MGTKFEGVDVLYFLGQVVELHTQHYKEDFDMDIELIPKLALSGEPEDRRLLWMSRPCGTYCLSEREVYLQESNENKVWMFYHEQTHDLILAYALTLDGLQDGKVIGSIYPLDYPSHVERVKSLSCPIDQVTVTFEDGAQFTLPYQSQRRQINELMPEHGAPKSMQYEPYDYTINSTYKHPMTEKRIEEIAKESNVVITDIKQIDCLLLGVQNNYKSGERDWGSRIIVGEDNFNALSGETISVSKGSYTVYCDSSMEYKLNAFFAASSLFYNPTTQQEFSLTQNEPICRNGLFNTRSIFSSFLILNDEDYRAIASALADEYKAASYMVNVENWQGTTDFQNNILKAVISDNDGVIFTNWHNSATFEKTGSQAEYLPFEGNETKIARLWSLYPLSKLSSTTTQFEAFATYLMLMLFIAIVAFVSAVMVIGLKLISTIWDDAAVYENLRRLGMKQKKIKGLITKQMLFVYFIPTVLGCLIGAFTTYRIMLVSGVIYIGETMQLVGFVCGLVMVIQLAIFSVLRSRIIKNYI